MLLVQDMIEKLTEGDGVRAYIGITLRHDDGRILRKRLLMLLDKAPKLAHFRRVTIRVEGPSDSFPTKAVVTNSQSNSVSSTELCDEEILGAVAKTQLTLGSVETKFIDKHENRRLVFQLAAGRS